MRTVSKGQKENLTLYFVNLNIPLFTLSNKSNYIKTERGKLQKEKKNLIFFPKKNIFLKEYLKKKTKWKLFSFKIKRYILSFLKRGINFFKKIRSIFPKEKLNSLKNVFSKIKIIFLEREKKFIFFHTKNHFL